MPLPSNNSAWPPRGMQLIFDRMREWNAWYSGNPKELHDVYRRQNASASHTRPSQMSGGIVGAAARLWWGRPQIGQSGQSNRMMHVPLAADLARTSADLLYSRPPEIAVDEANEGNKATNDRLHEFMQDSLLVALSAGAETGAALGGRYHRVVWDRQVSDTPFLTTVDADAAIPQFRWGRLVAVTFWRVLDRDGQRVLRHLEHHELDATGNGLVLHGLYDGSDENLGRVIPLTEHPAVQHLATQVDEFGAITEGRTPGLCVAYVPNITPQREWRDHPVGKDLGRSLYSGGVTGLMDAVDEAYDSWMRDLRLAKSRLIVPAQYLENLGPGQGTAFNVDAEIYSPLNIPLPEVDSGSNIEQVQFAIRFEAHRETISQLIDNILRSAGYSASTFGEEDAEGSALTATEVSARQSRSSTTRGRRVRLERPALAHLMNKMLTIDQAIFGTPGVVPQPVSVDFGPMNEPSALQLAQTAQAMATARAASTQTLVAMVHPDWTPAQITEEVGRISAENALSDPTSPAMFG